MTTRQESLIQEAQQLLQLYNNPAAQRRRLQRIVGEMQSAGADTRWLKQQLATLDAPSTDRWRCRYQLEE